MATSGACAIGVVATAAAKGGAAAAMGGETTLAIGYRCSGCFRCCGDGVSTSAPAAAVKSVRRTLPNDNDAAGVTGYTIPSSPLSTGLSVDDNDAAPSSCGVIMRGGVAATGGSMAVAPLTVLTASLTPTAPDATAVATAAAAAAKG